MYPGLNTVTTLVIFLSMQAQLVLFDFNKEANAGPWTVVNDVVMGGRSNASVKINDDGMGVFSGHVSLENNGGFASIRMRLAPLDISGFNTIHLQVRGRPSRFQLRCKSGWGEPQSYISYFEISDSWQEVSLPLTDMYPTFRGIRLEMPDYPAEVLAEIAILIGNKKEEDFKLEISRIWLEK